MMSYLHHVPPPVLWLDHVHPSSSQTESRATLQFPDCITCSPPVPWLYHMLPSSSQTVSRATLEFTKCIMPPHDTFYCLLYTIRGVHIFQNTKVTWILLYNLGGGGVSIFSPKTQKCHVYFCTT